MKLVIFDCDGTLVDSQHGIVDSMSRALANEGFSPLPRDRILSVVGLSLSLAVQRLLPEA
ncbi:MAG: HAD hydrolase-like protein, partial [Pseudomonadota bacterium]